MSLAMRRRADWMTRNDDVVLEILLDADPIAIPPQVVHYHIEQSSATLEVTKQTVSNRLQKLNQANLVSRERGDAGYYRLSDHGRDYLNGDAEAPDIGGDGDHSR